MRLGVGARHILRPLGYPLVNLRPLIELLLHDPGTRLVSESVLNFSRGPFLARLLLGIFEGSLLYKLLMIQLLLVVAVAAAAADPKFELIIGRLQPLVVLCQLVPFGSGLIYKDG
jgi:hypothetical protein